MNPIFWKIGRDIQKSPASREVKLFGFADVKPKIFNFIQQGPVNTLLADPSLGFFSSAMSKTLTLELPDDAFSALRSSPEEFGRELRLAAAIKWYEMERISQGKAAEIAGVSRSAFIEALDRYGVSPIQVTPAELEREVQQAFTAESSRSAESPDE